MPIPTNFLSRHALRAGSSIAFGRSGFRRRLYSLPARRFTARWHQSGYHRDSRRGIKCEIIPDGFAEHPAADELRFAEDALSQLPEID
jgi:hypothetical protein